MLRKWGMLLLVLLISPMLAYAQTTGKLAGRVMDADTGEPLPGASVVIEGTQQGTITDLDGNYFIIGVPVGSYDVRASFVGFQTATVTGVEISAGYTREINFDLTAGVELNEIVVEYERPLIQKDAIGVPNVVSAEDIANLPVRGVASLAAIQGGVVSSETSGALFIRGGRSAEVAYFVDGVRVIGAVGVPTQAIQEQEMLIGSIPARYGDAMSGVISITTKGGSREFFGSLEAISSEATDDYGYNNYALTVGGPLVGDKVSFFAAAEVSSRGDAGPRAVGFPTLSADQRSAMQAAPQVVRVTNGDGDVSYISFPGNLLELADANNQVSTDAVDALLAEQLAAYRASNGDTTWALATRPVPLLAPLTYSSGVLSREAARVNNESNGFSFNGNVTLQPLESVRVRIGAGLDQSSGTGFSYTQSLYNSDSFSNYDRSTTRLNAAWTHYLSNTTFYQVQADWTNYNGKDYHPDFGDDINKVMDYGKIDNANNVETANYWRYNSDAGVYEQQYSDGSFPASANIQNTFLQYGARGSSFSQFDYTKVGFRASATTQIGLHQVEFGGEYEQRTNRYWSIFAYPLAREEGTLAEQEASLLDNLVYYYGYTIDGLSTADSEDIDTYAGAAQSGNRADWNIAPYQPIYYAGYISDKIEYRDIVLQIGMRMDVFDNNTFVPLDPYALFPIQRAGEAGLATGTIGSDFAVYYDESSGAVRGFRDLDGNFYDPNGNETDPNSVKLNSAPKVSTDANGSEIRSLNSAIFTDYEPQSTLQPRIGVSFPVTDRALFFASYDVTTQRPSERNYDTVQSWRQNIQDPGRLNNSNLMPEKTTQYELGFRQRIGDRAAFQISGFFRQIEDKIQRRIIQNVFPNNYQSYSNVDFGTVKGVEMEFDLRRTNNVSLNANYTLSFAKGTGADADAVGQITWRQETSPFYPNFISPLDFDQRHKFNFTVDYRLGEGEGPKVGGATPLENFGINLVGTIGTGLPYTRRTDDSPLYTSFNGFLNGEINGLAMPSTAMLNLRVDKKLSLGGLNMTAFVWVQNLLDADNVQNVWSQTGLATDDGYLDTPLGREQVAAVEASQSPQIAQSFVDHYGFRANSPFNYGIPRMTRIGVRVDF